MVISLLIYNIVSVITVTNLIIGNLNLTNCKFKNISKYDLLSIITSHMSFFATIEDIENDNFLYCRRLPYLRIIINKILKQCN
jgi:hypothetical protein